MAKRTSKQAPIFVAATELPVSAGHPFYAKLNTILDGAGFDRFAEAQGGRYALTAVTAARDAFCAALVVSLLPARERGEALARARAAGAIGASRPGAKPSLPTAAELGQLLAR